MPATTDDALRVEVATLLDYERLRVALRDAATGNVQSVLSETVIGEIAAHRERIATPLSAGHVKRPSAEDRTKIAGLSHAILTIPALEETTPPRRVQLHSEHIEAALHLSTQLDINEIDAALLLIDARSAAMHRPDMDVIAAATQLFKVRRRESVHYLQELLRSPLIPATNEQAQQFVSLLVNERNLLVKEQSIISKLLYRIQSALNCIQEPNGNSREALYDGEIVMLAECLFLLAYTVQVSSTEALGIRSLLENIGAYHKKIVDEECEKTNLNQVQTQSPFAIQAQPNSSAPNTSSEFRPESRVDLDSTLNLVLLSWMCALDRSRYQDVYDPRTGESNINILLRDESFIRQTTKLPPMTDGFSVMVNNLDKAVLAAEFIGAVFRLAVASPDEDEASQTALRVSAYGGCLSYLAYDLPTWIESGAGSMTPDADLYADALEDLAIDTAEAPRLASEFVYWHGTEISRIAANLAQDSYLESTMSDDQLYVSGSPGAKGIGSRPMASPQARFGDNGTSPFAPRASVNSTTPTGKPPLPPSNRPPSLPRFGNGLETPRQSAFNFGADKQANAEATQNEFSNGNADPNSKFCLMNNVVALLARFVGRAMKLSPGKLEMESVFKGARYWVGMEGPASGFIMRISEAVWDIYEAAGRNIFLGGGVGTAFTEALEAFLFLLTASVGRNNPVHAAQALRFLINAGDALVSMNKLKQALDHFIQLIKQPLASMSGNVPSAYSPIEDNEASLIAGIVDVITAAANGLNDQGGLDAFLGGLGSDLGMKIADLAIFNVNPNLRASLISALIALQDNRAIVFFLNNSSKNNADILQHLTNSIEGEVGQYNVTVNILDLAESCTKWREEDYPFAAIESIAMHFAIEEVLNKWSRRMYASENERWRIIKAAANFLLSLGYREAGTPNRSRMLRVMSKLLMPAPGTGAASQALRSLFAATGLLRYPESASYTSGPPAIAYEAGNVYSAKGKDLLMQTASSGLGETYRSMEQAVIICSKVILGLFDITPGEVASVGQVSASVSDLIVMEAASIISASSMVFSIDLSYPKMYKAGYSEEACSSVLMMLAVSSQSSVKIAGLLASQAEAKPTSLFRSSLADIIAQGEVSLTEATSQDNEAQLASQPLLYSALRIVESCLGVDGGGPPGLYLLGLNFDSSGRFTSAEYGVLKALLELMNSSSGFIDRLDGKARATAAVFIQRLAANTIRKTSQAVNEYLKEVSEVDGSTRGGSFADEMLFRILDFVASGAADSSSWLSIDWSNIAELAGACMSLSALHVHIFPESELHRPSRREFHDSGPDKEDLISSPKSLNGAPSPYELFRLIVFISSHVPRDVVFETFRSWYSLLGIRAIIETTNYSPAPIPIFLELTSTLLNALASADTSNEMALLVRKDGGFIACSAVLTCVKYICEWANPHSSEHKLIGEAQVTDLLAGIIAAASGLVGSGLDTSRARTMLYTSFLQVAPVARKIVSDEGLARAFGGRVGARQVSGSEGLIASCCLDSVGCPSPATKAVSLATACMVTLMDPVRSVPALSAQNRLRRIVATSIADVDARSLIARACNRSGAEMKASDPEMSRERAAKVVGEAALSLVHAVSTALNGHRALVDSGCVEAVAGLLMFLESSRLGNIMAENQSMQRFGSSSVDANGSIINVGEDNMDVANDSFYLYGASGPGERRASLIASISSAVAAALICPDSALVEGAFDLLEKGHGCFTDIFRMLRSGRPAYLEALSSLSLILSRIPPKLFIAAGDPYLLRFSLAGALHVFVTPRTDSRNIESTISNLRIGFASRQPSNRNEVLRSKVLHPYGGSIFDRDIVDERISCLHSIMAALRPQCGNVFLFEATLETSTGSRGFGVWQTLLHLIGSLTTKSLLLNYWMFFVSLVPCGKMFDDTPKKVFRQEQQAMRTR